MDELIKLLDSDLTCKGYRIKDNKIILEVYSTKVDCIFPFCGHISSKVHAAYIREVQDIPIQQNQTILLILTRKMRCDNSECSHKTFSERFDFLAPNAKKTKRLVDCILSSATQLSSLKCTTLLKLNKIQVGKSSVCELVKKNITACE